MTLPNRLTLESHANAQGVDLHAFADLTDGLHEDLHEDIFKVAAILRGAPDEYPIYLLEGLTVPRSVAVQACEEGPTAIGDLVMLPEELGEQRDDWFALRRVVPLEERNRRIGLVTTALKPHMQALCSFAAGLGLTELKTGLEIECEPMHIMVAGVAKAILDDGTQVSIRAEVSFDGLVGSPGYSGTLFARRQRFLNGEHIGTDQRQAFFEAGLATSVNPVHLFSTWPLFDDLEDETSLVYVLEALDLKAELAKLDVTPLHLGERAA